MNFVKGDKVKLKVRRCTDEFYAITEGMLMEPDVLTIELVSPSGAYGTRIKVKENDYNYHPSWLELITPKNGFEKVESESIIKGQFFGNSKVYEWKCDTTLFSAIEVGQLVVVDTVRGRQVIRVSEKVELEKGKSIATKSAIALYL